MNFDRLLKVPLYIYFDKEIILSVISIIYIMGMPCFFFFKKIGKINVQVTTSTILEQVVTFGSKDPWASITRNVIQQR